MKSLSESLLPEAMKHGVISFTIAGISLLNVPAVSLATSVNPAAVDDGIIVAMRDPSLPVAEVIWHEPEPVAADAVNSTVYESARPVVVPAPVATESAELIDDDMTMLFIAGGAAALGAAVLIGNNSGGSDSGQAVASVEPEPEPEPETPLVGPDMNGEWGGQLILNDKEHRGYQSVTASVVHEGSSVKITTSGTLDYGNYFSGTISSGGYMYMYESVTGQVWTTHKGNARSNKMELYDYVNNFQDYDELFLYK